MQTPRTRPKSTKTAKLVKETTAKKLETLENYFRDTNSLFKLKKFQSSKPRIDTINRNYVPPSNKSSIFQLNNSLIRETTKASNSPN